MIDDTPFVGETNRRVTDSKDLTAAGGPGTRPGDPPNWLAENTENTVPGRTKMFAHLRDGPKPGAHEAQNLSGCATAPNHAEHVYSPFVPPSSGGNNGSTISLASIIVDGFMAFTFSRSSRKELLLGPRLLRRKSLFS